MIAAKSIRPLSRNPEGELPGRHSVGGTAEGRLLRRDKTQLTEIRSRNREERDICARNRGLREVDSSPAWRCGSCCRRRWPPSSESRFGIGAAARRRSQGERNSGGMGWDGDEITRAGAGEQARESGSSSLPYPPCCAC